MMGVVLVAQAAAALLGLFPPRGIVRLLLAEHTNAGGTALERLVGEEYVLDTIHHFEGDRVQCARRLAGGARMRA
jgi:nuclear cap-binding protein subunit 1